MISFAAQGGGVGPHYDYYDVFLLQGSGERHWQVGERWASTESQRPNTELNLLQEFEPKMEFTLSAGDALYIPPRFSHWGTATSDGLCYSIGFRAPSLAEMIEGFSDLIIKEQNPVNRYEDSSVTSHLRSGEIEPQLLDKSFQQLSERLADKSKFITWFGCHVSQPKYPELIQGLDQPLSSEEFAVLLGEGVEPVQKPEFAFCIPGIRAMKPRCCSSSMAQWSPFLSFSFRISLHCASTAILVQKARLACSQTLGWRNYCGNS